MEEHQQPEFKNQQEEVDTEPEADLADKGPFVHAKVPFQFPAHYHNEPDWDEEPNWVHSCGCECT